MINIMAALAMNCLIHTNMATSTTSTFILAIIRCLYIVMLNCQSPTREKKGTQESADVLRPNYNDVAKQNR